ncbi:hypothetical protein [Mesorhizobium sp. M0571]|uniref:hypothetical protein n=1 Tax=Mesorhizobium sp. M0571 TaxID=2956960 RepID=UPI00333B384C
MRANLGFPLSIEYIRSAPVDDLLNALKAWLVRENPNCLMHPHGFFVVPLDRTESEDWRFHLWPEGPRIVAGMPAFIHTHDRHVESRILQGELTNVDYQVAAVAKEGRPLYNVGYGGDRYTRSTSNFLYKTATRVAAEIQNRKTLGKGECYRVERHAYHEAIASERLTTATLVWMHSRLPGPVHVVGCDGYPVKIEFQRVEHRAQEFAGHIVT